MFGSTVLEVAIGLVFIYCLYSLLTTTINEIISSILGLRGKKLELAIKRMLTDENKAGSALSNQLFDKFFSQPTIKYMTDGRRDSWKGLKRVPSYIAAGDFSKGVIDSLKEIADSKGQLSLSMVTSALDKLDPQRKSDTVRLLDSFLQDGSNDLTKFRTQLEQWFDGMMERTSGWYKRQTQWTTFVIGLVMAMSFNVNTFDIVKHLSKDDSARGQIVQLATNYVKNHPAGSGDTSGARKADSEIAQRLDSLVAFADSLYRTDIFQSNQLLGMGWPSFCEFWKGITWTSLIGWLVTALAISLGAPFWFDLLSKLIQLRGTGTKPEDQKTKSSKEVEIMKRRG
jgi:hypothetical protein